jgi:hypothetical protein
MGNHEEHGIKIPYSVVNTKNSRALVRRLLTGTVRYVGCVRGVEVPTLDIIMKRYPLQLLSLSTNNKAVADGRADTGLEDENKTSLRIHTTTEHHQRNKSSHIIHPVEQDAAALVRSQCFNAKN